MFSSGASITFFNVLFFGELTHIFLQPGFFDVSIPSTSLKQVHYAWKKWEVQPKRIERSGSWEMFKAKDVYTKVWLPRFPSKKVCKMIQKLSFCRKTGGGSWGPLNFATQKKTCITNVWCQTGFLFPIFAFQIKCMLIAYNTYRIHFLELNTCSSRKLPKYACHFENSKFVANITLGVSWNVFVRKIRGLHFFGSH